MARTTTGVGEVRLLLEILKRIPSDRKISSTELLTVLENSGFSVNKRTFQRYLKELVEADCGIMCDSSSKPFGYRRTKTVTSLETLRLDNNAKLLLNLAKEQLKYQLPPEVSNSLDYLFSESDDPGRGSEDKLRQKWLDKVAVVSGSIPMMPPKILTRIFNEVAAGLFEGKQLDISYTTSDGKDKQVRVSPLGLVQQEVRLYLVCEYVGSGELRHFALHRMKDVRIVDMQAEYPKNFNLKSYVKNNHFNYGSGSKVQLRIEFTNPITAVNMKETPFNPTQKIVQLDNGNFELTVEIEDSILLNGWIESWRESGGFVKVEKNEIIENTKAGQS